MFSLGTIGELRVAALGVLLAAILGWAVYEHHHLIAEGKAQELATLKASSDALLKQAQANIVKETAQHAADVKANEEKTDAALSAANAFSTALDQRVRDFDAYRHSHPDVPRPASGSGPAGQGECGTRGCGEVAAELAVRGNELARSVGELTAVLQSAQRDRDSLTGLPR